VRATAALVPCGRSCRGAGDGCRGCRAGEEPRGCGRRLRWCRAGEERAGAGDGCAGAVRARSARVRGVLMVRGTAAPDAGDPAAVRATAALVPCGRGARWRARGRLSVGEG